MAPQEYAQLSDRIQAQDVEHQRVQRVVPQQAESWSRGRRNVLLTGLLAVALVWIGYSLTSATSGSLPYNSLPTGGDDVYNSSSLPVVLWHGMGDSCCATWSIGALQKQIEEALPGIFVHSIAVGDSIGQDTLGGYFGDVNTQVEAVCQHLANIPQLQKGYNAVGFSQGGQFLRAVLERCQHRDNMPKMQRLITLGGQHQGIMNLPSCTGPSYNQTLSMPCKLVQRLLGFGAYLPWIRSHVVQAQYFKDPYNYDKYLRNNHFLADINNERPAKQQIYKDNMLSLKQLVLVRFSDDLLVVPRDSAWFSYWNGHQLQSMNETQLYQEDWIGLQALDERGAIRLEECPGRHMEVTLKYFQQHVIQPYLKAT